MLNEQFFITADTINQYAVYLRTEERADATIEKYIRDIRVFANFLSGAKATKEAAIDWKEKLKATHEATSINSMIAAINGFFEFFKLDIKIKPLKIQRKIFVSADKELKKAEYEKLLQAAKIKKKERILLVLQTICATGIRVSELKFITIEAIKKGQTEITNKGKIRIIFISNDLKRLLLKYAINRNISTGSIFITKSGKPLDRSNIWAAMKKLCESAGVNPSKCFPHNLRKIFAHEFYKKTKDIVKLADLLGHSDVQTTRIYIMESGESHRRIVESLGLARLIT